MSRVRLLACVIVLNIAFCAMNRLTAQVQWYECESKHFRIIYRAGHAHLVEHILNSAEAALQRLSIIFSYTPSGKIVINTHDVNDYGGAAASSVPVNYIWLDLSPLEPGYENIPYSERFQWLLNHELVHVVVNDLAPDIEKFNRFIFSKVAPVQNQPLTVLYSLLTNYGRYTPRWHQEGVAVFLETWMSGGFGRTMGSFDEMYFRSLVAEGKEFPSDIYLESKTPHQSFLTETNHYTYGGRFVSHLVKQYGISKLFEWFTPQKSDFYKNFSQRFKQAYGIDFSAAWREFEQSEQQFQRSNLAILEGAPITPITRLSDTPSGAVSHPNVDSSGRFLFWAKHRPHHLAGIQRFDRRTRTSIEMATLPTPGAHQVTSTAFNAETDLLFFTTNNNQLYRDLWMLDATTGKRRLLFEDCRVGHLTVSSLTNELWGIRHGGGVATLVSFTPPYDSLVEHIHFDIGDEIHGIAVSPDGSRLAAVLHRASGDQSIVLSDCEKIRKGEPASYSVITDKGSPENPSWSPDNKWLYWNAFTNGVSNIYRRSMESGTTEAISHTRIGLFKPLHLSKDSVFAFEFSTDGFYPVLIPNVPAQRLPAIKYLGQQIQEMYPEVADFAVAQQEIADTNVPNLMANEYNGFDHLKVVSFVPVLTGFQSKKVLGVFGQVSDPILNHDLIVETGVSPFRERNQPTQFHIRLKYEYQKSFEVGWEYNSPDFYDLFNKRKRGLYGNQFRLGNTHYWVYDNPYKLKQRSELTLYSGVEFINDNLVPVSQPDFVVGRTTLTSQYLRRSIGSGDHEFGNEIGVTAMIFGANLRRPELGVQLYAEWDHFATYLAPHNVLHLKLAGGYHPTNKKLVQSRFYFGGFGNRAVENVDAKQFRTVFRFPGAPIYSIGVDRFAKLMVENNFPPLRFGDVSLGQHLLSHVDASLFSQTLLANGSRWFSVNAGFQMNCVFRHWFNLESTLSAGVARAWINGRHADEWFVSLKLLKN